MILLTETACLPVAMDASIGQRQIMAKIVDVRSEILHLRLDLDDAITELVSVTDWADGDTPAEQKLALEKVTDCRRRLALAEAKIDRLHLRLVDSVHRP